MREDEYGRYLEVLRAAYLEDLLGSGMLDRADAETKVEEDIRTELPDGPRTPDSYLYVVEDDAGPQVGYAWMATRPDQLGRQVAFVFDIWVREESRGRGLGRAAMLALEDEGPRPRLDRIRLNVFGQNEAARRLYRSLGYVEFSVLMGKTLVPPGS